MRFMTKNKLQKRFSVLVSCILTVFIVMNALTVPALSVGAETDINVSPAEDCIFLEYMNTSDEYSFTPVLYSAVVPFAEIVDNALKLEFGDNITSIIISYLIGDNWVEITEEYSTDMPSNTNYQFEFAYNNISVKDLCLNWSETKTADTTLNMN